MISKQQRSKLLCTAIAAIAIPVISQAQPMVYIANAGGNYVSAVNMTTQSVQLAWMPDQTVAVAVSSNGATLYAVGTANHVFVMNAATLDIEATVATGSYPAAVAVDPNGAYFYVANQGSNTVSVYSMATTNLVGTISVGSGPSALAFAPGAAETLFVANTYANTVTAINTSTFAVAGTFATGSGPCSLAYSTLNNWLYVANCYDNTVTVYTPAGALVTTITGFSYPDGLAMDGPQGTMYVSNGNAGTASVVNVYSNLVVATIPAGSLPSAVAVSPDGGQAYVANEFDFSLSQIQTGTNTLMNTLFNVALYPVAVAVH